MTATLVEQINHAITEREAISMDAYGAKKAFDLLEASNDLLEKALPLVKSALSHPPAGIEAAVEAARLADRLEDAKLYRCECCPEEMNCHPIAEVFVCDDGVFCEECWGESGRTDGIRAAILAALPHLRDAPAALSGAGAGAVAFIQREALAELRKHKNASATVSSGRLSGTFGDQVPLYAHATPSVSPAAERDIFTAGWRTNATTEQPAEYLDGCEQVDWLDFQKRGLAGYLASLKPEPAERTEAGPSCSHCNDTGFVAIRASNGTYSHPGPVPHDAKGFAEARCWECLANPTGFDGPTGAD